MPAKANAKDKPQTSTRTKPVAEQRMAEYNLDGWTASDLINPDDISAIMNNSRNK